MANANALSTPLAVEIRALGAGDDFSAFRTLNEEWIRRYFVLEPKDIETLTDPERYILRQGGYIYLLSANNQPAGCVALIPMSGGMYELSKMAVSPALRGQGLGRRLLLYAIEEARRIGATSLFLGSNTKLADAVHLYEAAGFRHVSPASLPPNPYSRANVFMEMKL